MNIPLRTNDGRIVATLHSNTAIVHKRVIERTHMLRSPPSWTYDEHVIDTVKSYMQKHAHDSLQFVIDTTDTKKTYRLSWDAFDKHAFPMKWRQNSSQKQWAVPLKYWSIDGEEKPEQLRLL